MVASLPRDSTPDSEISFLAAPAAPSPAWALQLLQGPSALLRHQPLLLLPRICLQKGRPSEETKCFVPRFLRSPLTTCRGQRRAAGGVPGSLGAAGSRTRPCSPAGQSLDACPGAESVQSMRLGGVRPQESQWAAAVASLLQTARSLRSPWAASVLGRHQPRMSSQEPVCDLVLCQRQGDSGWKWRGLPGGREVMPALGCLQTEASSFAQALGPGQS